MSLIDSIASFSTAQSMAEVQSAVAIKVLKIAQGQGQVATDLIEGAAEVAQECLDQAAADTGARLNVLA